MIKDYLNLPQSVKGVGTLHAVSILEWEEFQTLAHRFLLFSYDYLEYRLNLTNVKMLDFLVSLVLQSEDGDERVRHLMDLHRLFEIVFKEPVQSFMNPKTNQWTFKIGESGVLTSEQFDDVKAIILRQNLLYEPLTVQDENAQQFINEHLERASRMGEPVEMESMLAYVSHAKGLDPSAFQTYTYYQLRVDFEIAQKMESNLYIHMYRTQGAKAEPVSVTGKLSIHENPYSIDKIFNKVDERQDQHLQKMMSGF